MKLSTKPRYSVRLMIDLVLHGGHGPVLLKDIARRQEISEKYLGHLVPLLKSSGMISATRGAKGGITLARSPADVTLKDIIEAVEGPICLVGCLDDVMVCKRKGRCAARDFWAEATNDIIKVFEKYTLKQMAEHMSRLASGDSYAI